MSKFRLELISDFLFEEFGLVFKVESRLEKLEIRPSDLEYGEAFKIIIQPEWRSLKACFVPDNFSAPLLKTMSEANRSKKEVFNYLLGEFSDKYEKVILIIDNCIIQTNIMDYSKQWRNMSIELNQSPIIIRELSEQDLEKAVNNILVDILSLVLSLLPIEDNKNEYDLKGLPEAALKKVMVNKYERKLINRKLCIKIHGSKCKVCEFDFEERYGEIGVGFIHVHHVTPISQLTSNYEIDVRTDLIPLCPNCHAMIHKRNPPYTISELKDKLK